MASNVEQDTAQAYKNLTVAMFRWRWKCCKCSCRCCMIVTVALIISAAFYVNSLIQKESCTDEISQQILHDMCSMYRAGVFAGSYCHKLCDTKELQYQSCTNYRRGKKVFFMTCQGCGQGNTDIPVVFKMKETLEERDKLDHTFVPMDGKEDNLKQFEDTVERMVKNSYMFKFSKDMSKVNDILSYTWGWDFHDFLEMSESTREKSMLVAVRNIWSLSEQHEYLMSKMLQNETFLPKIYGTCGPAYFTEFTPTLRKYEYEFFNSWSQAWDNRAILAIKLIDLVNVLDFGLHETLNLCDVKADNFGIHVHGKRDVTLIDTDCAMFQTDLIEQFNYSKCSTHEDCDFFDCRGYCDMKNKKCLLRRTNNNLQTLCEDVLQGLSSRFPTGLLRDPPISIKAELYSILQECVYPGPVPDRHSVRDKTPWKTGQALQDLLKRSVKHTDFGYKRDNTFRRL